MVGRIVITALFLISLVGLGVADALVLQPHPPLETLNISTAISQIQNVDLTPGTDTNTSNSGVKKKEINPINDALKGLGVETQELDEPTVLEQIIQANIQLKQYNIMKNNDRAGSIAWIETPDVKDYFVVLKESLVQSFSPDVQGLVDETRKPPGKPVMNYLTFYDPSIAEERLIFLRVRKRLYELHVPSGKEELAADIVESLSQ